MWKSAILLGSLSSIQALNQTSKKTHIQKDKKKQFGGIKLGVYTNAFKKQ